MNSIFTKKVAMIGVGKLGQSCAEVISKSYELVGYDVEIRNPHNFRMVSTIKEAVQLVLQTPSLDTSGKIFILDMGEPIKITDGVNELKNDFSTGFKISNLSFSFPGRSKNVLDNLNVDIPVGKTFALVGPSGAGKTTLTKKIQQNIRLLKYLYHTQLSNQE